MDIRSSKGVWKQEFGFVTGCQVAFGWGYQPATDTASFDGFEGMDSRLGAWFTFDVLGGEMTFACRFWRAILAFWCRRRLRELVVGRVPAVSGTACLLQSVNVFRRRVAWWQRGGKGEAAAGLRARCFRARHHGVPVAVIAWLTSTCFGLVVNAAEIPLVLTQVPRRAASDPPVQPGSPLSPSSAERGRIVRVSTDGMLNVLTPGFHSAADPEISFDAKRMLFAGKRTAADKWTIYEREFDTGKVRRITRGRGNCRQPIYQSTLFTIVSPEPWYQLTFVSDMAGKMNENGSGVARSLYSCKLDGSQTRRLTYNLSDDADPFLMRDGRLLYGGWQRGTLRRGDKGRVSLFAVNIDGTDNALFADTSGRLVKRMPCVTDQGLVVFVESGFGGDGSGQLSAVSFRRPLHSYRPITSPADGYLYRSPSPWPAGHVIVSRRRRADTSTYGIAVFNPRTGKAKTLLDTADYDEVQAVAVRGRRESDGRSSVVDERTPYGELYCLNVNVNDFSDRAWHPPGTARRVRLLQGVALDASDSDCYLEPLPGTSRRPGSTCNGLPPLVQRRILGEVDIKADGSFNVKIPANTPIQLQTVDKNGVALRSCGWIWAKNHEPRGCIGCHEDGELTPENAFVDSMKKPSIPLTLPPKRRRTVDFRRDLMPIIEQKCIGCHDSRGTPPRLDGGLKVVSRGEQAHFNRAYLNLLAEQPSAGPDGTSNGGAAECGSRRYVTPGKSRTSPLIWHLFGRNLARPWDGRVADQKATPIPNVPDEVEPLTELERRTFAEWVDMGALWDGVPDANE